MRVHAPLLFVVLTAARLYAADVTWTMIPSPAAITAGSETVVDIVALNPDTSPAPFKTSSSLIGRLTTGSESWTVELQAASPLLNEVEPRSFAVRRYRFTIPTDALGPAVLEVTEGGGSPIRTVLDVRTVQATGEQVASPTSFGPVGSSTKAVEAVVNRTFAGRLRPNEPIYFVYGNGGESAAKFQFSFDYRLATIPWRAQKQRMETDLVLGYTQRSLWDIDARSSPFRDTSYMPEIALDINASLPDQSNPWFTWIGLRTGFMHESNGRADDDSRSLNTVYLRPAAAIGPIDSWHLLVFPEIWGYVSTEDDRGSIKDYRGYGRLRMVLGKNNGASLLFTGWAGRELDNFSYQLDFAYPIQTRLLAFESFVLVQYFKGYGESLLSYDERSDSLRVGLALLR